MQASSNEKAKSCSAARAGQATSERAAARDASAFGASADTFGRAARCDSGHAEPQILASDREG